MNKVNLIGRLTRDPEVRYSNDTCVARYTLAVDRRFSKENEADFIRCIAFGKSGEFVEKYLKKGMKVAMCGRIQTGSYTNKDGQKIYTTDVVAEEHYFIEPKKSDTPSAEPSSVGDGFMNIPDGIDEELPFA